MPSKATNYALLFDSTTMTGTAVCTSKPIKLLDLQGASIQITWTGTPTGNFRLRVSNDQAIVPTDMSSPVSGQTLTNFSTVDTVAAGGAAGDQTWNLSNQNAAWAFVDYTNTGSTGVIASSRVTLK